MMRKRLIRIQPKVVMALTLCAFAGGCTDSESDAVDPVDDVSQTPVESEVSLSPISLSSTTACALDMDCADGTFCFQGRCAAECGEAVACGAGASCSERGQCILSGKADNPASPTGVPATPDVLPNLTIMTAPPWRQPVQSGQATVTLSITLSGDVPAAGVAYRVERTDDASTAGDVKHAMGAGPTFDITLDTRLADPAQPDSAPVDIFIVTSAGTVGIGLVPERPIAGRYAGLANVALFGPHGLPLDVQLVTEPAGATLSTAQNAWLLLPVGPTRLFAPRKALEGKADTVQALLTYDDFVDRWVATFDHEFRLPGDTVFSQAVPGQIRRQIRVELDAPEGERITGEIKDTWTGFYNEVTSGGTQQLAVLNIVGSLELTRAGSAPAFDTLPTPNAPAPADPKLLGNPDLSTCTDAHLLAAPDREIDGKVYSCAGVATISDFESTSTEAQSDCAVALGTQALAGDTTAAQITAFLDDTVMNPNGESFADFMKACASGEGGTCRPNSDVLCGRQLAAYAYANQGLELADAPLLLDTYAELTREAFLGRQLGAFQTDADTRLKWLQTTDYPAIVTSAVRSTVETILDDWVANVLDVHMEVLSGQVDGSGLAMLSRKTTIPSSVERRKQLLLELTQTWRAAVDALAVATARWHELYQDADSRAERAAYVRGRMFDLYLSASVLSRLNLDAGAGYNNATFGGGFSAIARELTQLAQPFSELIYHRDAEVVVSTSLDPDSDNNTVLGDLELSARDEIDSAATAVQQILDDSQAKALSETQLRGEMNAELSELRAQLVELCGLPAGCSAGDLGTDAACDVRVGPAECGFTLDPASGNFQDFTSGQQNVSTAGEKLLGILLAVQAGNIASEDARAHTAKAGLALTALDSQASGLEGLRLEIVAGFDAMKAQIALYNGDRLAALTAWEAKLSAQIASRQAYVDGNKLDAAKWNSIRVDGIEYDFDQLVTVTALKQTALGATFVGEQADKWGEIMAEALPKIVGPSSDVNSVPRAAILSKAHITSTIAETAATALEAAASRVENTAEHVTALREAELQNLADLYSISGDQLELDLLTAGNEAASVRQEQADADTYLDQLLSAQQNQNILEIELAFQVLDVDARRHVLAGNLAQDGAGLQQRIAQAELNAELAVAEYLGVAQRAVLIEARIRELETHLQNVNQLIGSPAVVFNWANRLRQAESRLERAKDKLMDWLVAMEYFAVRPFLDQRIQILLARNTFQLEAIAQEMLRLQRACGGAVNEFSAAVSVRRDLLGITAPLVEGTTGIEVSTAERFRGLLERGRIPIDKRARYSGDSAIGDLVQRNDILAVTFDLTLDGFANLAAACNAKIVSFSIKLVGSNLGSGLPTVSILYDGTSQLRSCQPGLADYLKEQGSDATAFGETTRLRTPGRSVSPVAGINEFNPDGAANKSLGGLPLASQYTVLIDPTLGENGKIDWSALEDIELEVNYAYQDFFTPGQCQ
ncbi:MAG: hypothetical protein ACI9OJ_000778 [Myxococcota bacterium]|jgi:hypothetical protein